MWVTIWPAHTRWKDEDFCRTQGALSAAPLPLTATTTGGASSGGSPAAAYTAAVTVSRASARRRDFVRGQSMMCERTKKAAAAARTLHAVGRARRLHARRGVHCGAAGAAG